MGPILVDLSSACFGTLSRGAEIMDHLQYLLLGKCGCDTFVVAPQECAASPLLWLSRAYQKVPAMLSSLWTAENTFLFVEDVIHKIRLILWCLIR